MQCKMNAQSLLRHHVAFQLSTHKIITVAQKISLINVFNEINLFQEHSVITRLRKLVVSQQNLFIELVVKVKQAVKVKLNYGSQLNQSVDNDQTNK